MSAALIVIVLVSSLVVFAAQPPDRSAGLEDSFGALLDLREAENTEHQRAVNARTAREQLARIQQEGREELLDLESYLQRLGDAIDQLNTNSRDLEIEQDSAIRALQRTDAALATALANQQRARDGVVELVIALERDGRVLAGVDGRLDPLLFMTSALSADRLLLRLEGSGALLSAVRVRLDELVTAQQRLEALRRAQVQDRNRIALARQRLSTVTAELASIRDRQAQLIADNRVSDRRYRQLQDQHVRAQRKAGAEALQLQAQIAALSTRLDRLRDATNDPELARLIAQQGTGTVRAVDLASRPRLAWPVLPWRGLTAVFLDEEYEREIGLTHPAIDIRLPQGSPVAAAAPGIVLRVTDSNFGYSYLALAHAGGLVTIYGHLTSFAVEQGDHVRAGQLLGSSGGRPGTRGAGLLSTGPHLHFEVLDGGQHVDPLPYLPRAPLAVRDLPEA